MRALAILVLAAATAGAQEESALKRVAACLRPAVVLVECDRTEGRRTYGTGFLVSSDGIVATAETVVRGQVHIACYYRNESRIPARLVAVDQEAGLALVRLVAGAPYPTVSLADSDQQTAEGVAVGLCAYPPPAQLLASALALESRLRFGTIAAVHHDRATAATIALAADIALEPAELGAPLFRADSGRVVGLAAGGFGGTGSLTAAVPSNQIAATASQAGAELQPAPLSWGDPRCNLKPGVAGTLKLLRDDGELSPAFVAPVAYPRGQAAAVEALEYLVPALGYLPSMATRPAHDGETFLVGGLDETVRCFRQRRLGTTLEWSTALDYPVTAPPALTADVAVVTCGDLDPAGQARARSRNLIRTIATGVGYSGVVVPFAGALANAVRLFGNLFGEPKPKRELNTFGKVYLLDRADGSVRRSLDCAFPNRPVSAAGVAFVPSLGLLQAVRIADGSVLWQVGDLADKLDTRMWYELAIGDDGLLYSLELPVFLAIDNFERPDRTYFLMGGNRHQEPGDGLENRAVLRCRDPRTGGVRWTAPLGRVYDYAHPLATSLLVDTRGGRAYCQLGPLAAAVDLGTQKLAWPAQPALDQATEALAKVEWARKKQHQDDGAVRPHLLNGYLSGTSRGLLLVGDRLYHGAHAITIERGEKTALRAVSAKTGEALAEIEVPGRVSGAGVVAGTLYFAASVAESQPGTPPAWLYAYRESDRQPLWRLRLPSPGVTEPPWRIGDTLYLSDQNGLLQLPDPL